MPNLGQDFIVNSTPANFQAHPAIAALSDGHFVATWMSEDSGDGSGRLIRARVFDSNGIATANDFIVNSTTANDQIFPAITTLPGGNFIVTWYSVDGGDGSGSCIRARLFNSSGTAIGSDFIVESTTAGDQVIPAITILADGNVAITWTSKDFAVGSDHEIRARLFNASGSPLGNDFIVNSTTADLQSHPAITALANGHFVVTWGSGDGADGSSGCIRARLFDANGSAVANDFVANSTSASSQFDPKATALTDGHFVVTWTSADGGDGQGYCVRARLFDASGNAIGSDFIVNSTTAGNQNSPTIVALPAGQFAVTWFSDVGDGSGGCVTVRLFNPDGTPVGSDLVVNSTTGGDQIQPVITKLVDDDVAIAWTSLVGGISSPQEVRAAIVNLTAPEVPPHWAGSIVVGPHPVGWLPVATGDYNNDGTNDVLWYNQTNNNVEIWKILNGTWAGSVDIGAHPPGWRAAGSGDFNANGTDDVLWYNPTSGNAEIWKVVNGQWAGSVNLGQHPLGWEPGGVGDFNNDGTDDVLWFNASSGNAEIWKISDGGWAGSVDVGPHPPGWSPAGTGDFNDDGTSDILWFNQTTGAAEIWKMSNGGWAGSELLGSHPAGWQPAGTGDFNHDGTSDIVWFEPATGRIDLWLIADGNWAASVDLGAHPGSWVPAGVGDFNHDGISDLLWRETTTNQIETWLLSNS